MNTESEKIIQFTLLYNRYKKRLYNFILKLSGDTMIAEDIVQGVFIRFYENFEKMKNIESANYWLFKSARNEFYNYYKKSKRTTNFNETTIEKRDEFELEDYVELKEMKEIILGELNKMAIDQKEVYLLKEYGGLSYNEISKTLDMEVKLVKSRLYKVRQKLIDRISKLV